MYGPSCLGLPFSDAVSESFDTQSHLIFPGASELNGRTITAPLPRASVQSLISVGVPVSTPYSVQLVPHLMSAIRCICSKMRTNDTTPYKHTNPLSLSATAAARKPQPLLFFAFLPYNFFLSAFDVNISPSLAADVIIWCAESGRYTDGWLFPFYWLAKSTTSNFSTRMNSSCFD